MPLLLHSFCITQLFCILLTGFHSIHLPLQLFFFFLCLFVINGICTHTHALLLQALTPAQGTHEHRERGEGETATLSEGKHVCEQVSAARNWRRLWAARHFSQRSSPHSGLFLSWESQADIPLAPAHRSGRKRRYKPPFEILPVTSVVNLAIFGIGWSTKERQRALQ